MQLLAQKQACDNIKLLANLKAYSGPFSGPKAGVYAQKFSSGMNACISLDCSGSCTFLHQDTAWISMHNICCKLLLSLFIIVNRAWPFWVLFHGKGKNENQALSVNQLHHCYSPSETQCCLHKTSFAGPFPVGIEAAVGVFTIINNIVVL